MSRQSPLRSPIDCGFETPQDLILRGPTIKVRIGLGQVIGNRLFPALVDTGASNSFVDVATAEDLGLPVVGTRKIGGVHGIREVTVYLATLVVPAFEIMRFDRFASVSLEDQVHRAILGREFLSMFSMRYHGPSGMVMLQQPEQTAFPANRDL